jgi:uncharacterized protein
VSSPYEATRAFGVDAAAERTFLRQVFAWMFLALALTTGIAVWFHQSNATLDFFGAHPTLFYVAFLSIIPLSYAMRGVVRSPNVSVGVAALVLFVVAAIVGVVASVMLDVYTTYSVVGAFAGAAGVFGGMALVGYTTRVDLSRYSGIIFGAFWGVFVSSFVFIFTGGSAFNLVIGYVGVLVFSALTAFQVQGLKRMQAEGVGGGTAAEKLAILGAMQLYITFVNLFFSLLRIFGGARR